MPKFEKHKISLSGDGFQYVEFDNPLEFDGFISGQELSAHNQDQANQVQENAELRIEGGTTWYGSPAPKTISDLKDHRSFLNMSLVEEIKPLIQKYLEQLLEQLPENIRSTPKLAYNDRNIGVFSFDRALVGMFKDFGLDRTTKASVEESKLKIELGDFRVKSTAKKVFAYHEHRNMNLPALSIYLKAGGAANVEGDHILYVGIAVAQLVKFLEERRVPVQVKVMLGATYRKISTYGVIKIKGFQDPIDLNQLLLISSDPRYFRFKGFQGIIALGNHFGRKVPDNLGQPIDELAEKLAKEIDPTACWFRNCFSIDAAVREVKRIVESYHTQIKNE